MLVCAGPGIVTTGRTETPVNLIDMFPTLVELCQFQDSGSLDGLSFVPQLRDPSAKRSVPTITANGDGYSLRTERWRYISYHDGSEELYDHSADPMEWTNLASDPDFEEIKQRLKRDVPQNRVSPRSNKNSETIK